MYFCAKYQSKYSVCGDILGIIKLLWQVFGPVSMFYIALKLQLCQRANCEKCKVNKNVTIEFGFEKFKIILLKLGVKGRPTI